MENYLSKTLQERDNTSPETRLWRAVLNQALEDIFNVNTIIICGHEKNKVTDFFKVRTKKFDNICDLAGIDPERLWKRVQKLKGITAGFLLPETKDKKILSYFNAVSSKRNKYIQSHWRNNVR
jgi:hypothetical protein